MVKWFYVGILQGNFDLPTEGTEGGPVPNSSTADDSNKYSGSFVAEPSELTTVHVLPFFKLILNFVFSLILSTVHNKMLWKTRSQIFIRIWTRQTSMKKPWLTNKSESIHSIFCSISLNYIIKVRLMFRFCAFSSTDIEQIVSRMQTMINNKQQHSGRVRSMTKSTIHVILCYLLQLFSVFMESDGAMISK